MKKIFTFLIMSVFLLASMGTLMAADEVDVAVDVTSVQDIDSLDDSGIGWEKFKLAFTFKEERKAELAANIADKRLNKVAKLAYKGKFDEARKESLKYEEEVEDLEAYSQEVEAEIEVESEDETDEVRKAERLRVALERNLENQERAEMHRERSSEIKARILEKKSGELTEDQLAHMKEIFDKIDAKSGEKVDQIKEREGKLQLKYKILSGMTDEEIKAEIEAHRAILKERAENGEFKYRERIKIQSEDGKTEVEIEVELDDDSDDEDNEEEDDSDDVEEPKVPKSTA